MIRCFLTIKVIRRNDWVQLTNDLGLIDCNKGQIEIDELNASIEWCNGRFILDLET